MKTKQPYRFITLFILHTQIMIDILRNTCYGLVLNNKILVIVFTISTKRYLIKKLISAVEVGELTKWKQKTYLDIGKSPVSCLMQP